MRELTISQVADIAGVSRQSVHDAYQAGEFPHAHQLDPDRATSPILIPENDVQHWLKKRRAQAAKT